MECLCAFGDLGAGDGEEEDVRQAGDDDPVARHVTDLVGEEVLDEREDTAADDHRHEDTGSLVGSGAEAFDGEVEDGAPHDGRGRAGGLLQGP